MAVGCETWIYTVLSRPVIHEEVFGVGLTGSAIYCRWAGVSRFLYAALQQGFNLMQDYGMQRSLAEVWACWVVQEVNSTLERVQYWNCKSADSWLKKSFWKKKKKWLSLWRWSFAGVSRLLWNWCPREPAWLWLSAGWSGPIRTCWLFFFFLVFFDLIHCAALIAVKWNK